MIGIVVLNYNCYELTIDCVNSIIRQEQSANAVIIIVDNCSTDDSYKKLNSQFKEKINISIIKSDKNGGFSYGCNKGIEEFLANDDIEYILLINPDTIVEDHFLDYLRQTIESDKTIGAVSPKILYYDNPKIIWAMGGKTNYLYSARNGYLHERDNNCTDVIEASFLSGCCIMLRKSMINEIGLLSQEFFMYHEDVEYSDRIRANGYKLVCNPNAVIYHRVSMSSGGEKSNFNLYWTSRSHIIYINMKIREGQRFAKCICCAAVIRYFVKSVYYYFAYGKEKASFIIKGVLGLKYNEN